MTAGNPRGMKQGTGLAVGLVVGALIAGGGGYLLGNKGTTPQGMSDASAPSGNAPAGDAPKKERKLLYYRNPMGLPDTSPVPKKDPMGMDYIAV